MGLLGSNNYSTSSRFRSAAPHSLKMAKLSALRQLVADPNYPRRFDKSMRPNAGVESKSYPGCSKLELIKICMQLLRWNASTNQSVTLILMFRNLISIQICRIREDTCVHLLVLPTDLANIIRIRVPETSIAPFVEFQQLDIQ